MGIIETFKIFVFSEMHGTVLKGGKPVEGATVTRTGDHYNDKVYTSTATTDKDGKFVFKPIFTWSLRPLMLETVIDQEIQIAYQGKEYLGWRAYKQNTHQRGEIVDEKDRSKKPIICIFDLTQDDKKHQKLELSSVTYRSIDGLCELINQ